MKLKLLVMTLGAATAAAGTAVADEVVVGTGETHAFANEADVIQSDAVRVSDRAILRQSGTGKTTLKGGTFTENTPVSIEVAAGTVRLEASDTLVTSYPKPEDVLAKAAFWVDASESASLKMRDGTTDEVEAWLDARETGAGTDASPYVYTRAAAFTNDWLTAFPQSTAYQEKSAVYFRGTGSGCFMEWTAPDGTKRNFTDLRHAFVVTGVPGASTVGDFLGRHSSEPAGFLHFGSSALWNPGNNACEPIHAARSYLNGTEVDGAQTGYAATGIYAVEVQTVPGGPSLNASCFFNDRDYQVKGTTAAQATDANGTQINPFLGRAGQLNGGNRIGGDYLHEVIVFTNDLTAAERLAVSDWLNQKWRGVQPPAEMPSVSVALTASDAALEVGADSLVPAVSGRGVLRKTGEGAFALEPTFAPHNDALRLEVAVGSVCLSRAMPLACAAGDTLDADYGLCGTEVSAPTAGTDATKLVKTGTGPVTLDAIPSGVTRIEVKAGSLRLADPEVAQETVAIPNGDFETRADGFNASAFNIENAAYVTGYTIAQRTDGQAADNANAQNLTTFSAKGVQNCRWFNLAWNKAESETQLYMSGDGPTATTTFTPPAGTWHLRADFAAWATDYGGSQIGYSVAAKVTADGADGDLGTVGTNSHALVARTWPNAFTADGKTSVTLTLTGGAWQPSGVNDSNFSNFRKSAHGILDNLTLVRVPESGNVPEPENLFADGGFEKTSGTPWSIDVTPKPPLASGSGTISGSTSYSFDDGTYKQSLSCGARAEGSRLRTIVNDDAVYQTVTFAQGGLYRLAASFMSRSYLNGTTPNFAYGRNPVAFYFAKDGVTNWVYRTDEAATTNYNEYATLVRVPDGGGTWDVGFRGTSVWDGGATSVDRTMHMDAAHLYRVETAGALAIPEEFDIVVSSGAKLALDFAGTNVVRRLRIAGKGYSGLVSLETHPELLGTLSGCGTLLVKPRGAVIVVR